MNTELTLDPQFNPQTETKRNPAIKEPWNKGKMMGQKPPLKLKEVWEIRIRLQLGKRLRELALFNLAIDSKLRAMDMQQKPHQPAQFEITDQTRTSVLEWIKNAKLKSEDFLFPSRIHGSLHITTRQYARIVEKWVGSIGLNPADYGTHSFRRTKASLIYRRTKNLRAVQLLLGHTKLKSTVRYLGIEVDDTLEMAEQAEV